MNKTTQCLCLLLLLCTPLSALAQADPSIQDLYATEYFPAVHQEFQNAKESIVVTMYQIHLYPHTRSESPTFTLVRDLIDAHKRGVKVTVILNNPYRQHHVKEKRNSAVQLLTSGGITVRHASARKIFHQKLIVIDGETVICGSHNWNDTSLKYNIESSNLIKSKKYAALKLKQISQMELFPLEPGTHTPRPVVSVPLSFLTRKDLARDMMTDADVRAFDLYLLILRQSRDRSLTLSSPGGRGEYGGRDRSLTLPSPGGRGEYGGRDISLNHTTTASALGMNRRDGRTAYRRQITKTLRKLQNEYGLIECTFHYGRNTDVKLTALGLGGDKRIEVPEDYWKYGLSKKLSLPAKGAYLICLTEEAASPAKPWWTASQAALSDKYPGSRETIGQGLLELEKMDLLEIVRSNPPPEQSYSRRRPNNYRLKPLLSPKAIQEQWKELADAYGLTNLKRARAQAERFNRRNNHAVVSSLLMLADTYGWKLIGKAVGEVAKMVRDNPARHVGYIITLLRDWTKDGN